tara:strand:- start:505 stop:720 length:216 start_codon:yes stop_codon:yes gene_type:complete
MCLKGLGRVFAHVPTINEIIKVDCGAFGEAEFFENIYNRGFIMKFWFLTLFQFLTVALWGLLIFTLMFLFI